MSRRIQKYDSLYYRPDGNQNNLRNAAYEAIMEMMKNSPKVTVRECFKKKKLKSFISFVRQKKML